MSWRPEWLVAAASCAALCVGCSGTDPPTRACTEIGSPAGVVVTVEPAAVTDPLELTLRVCQADCVTEPVDLQPGSVTVSQTCTSDDPDGSCSASSSPDGSLLGFVDVAGLKSGPVRVSGELRTRSRTTPLAEVTVTAADTYPNGRDCPAGGPQATVRVTPTGLE